MKLALAQVNPTVGALRANRALVEEAAAKAAAEGADLVVLPEMVLTGYPPMDLLERDGFVEEQLRELEALAAASRDIAIVLGAVIPVQGGAPKQLLNTAVLLSGGERRAVRAKSLLPNYDVFDERRYFERAERREPVTLEGIDGPFGLAVCEDTWTERVPYDVDPIDDLVRAGASLILNPSASPWHAGKASARREMLASAARSHGVPIAFVNQVGGNDELIFDGGSFVVDAKGRFHAMLPSFETGLSLCELPLLGGQESADIDDGDPAAELERGLVLGIRDYFEKQDLPPGAVVALSGGIDSAVTAQLAALALGPEKLLGIAMPGPFSSEHSVSDALELGRLLGIEVRTVDIRPIYEAYISVFHTLFGEREDYGLTQQNIQSRIRGAVLMAVSNEEHRLVLATGNKSELSMGYCTLYGDTVGGLAVLGDVYKHDVYALAHHANQAEPRIPAGTIEKPPSAELAPNQLDSNELPDYDVLDALLAQAIEGGRSGSSLEPPPGCSAETALEISRRLDRNEYKRRQSPLVLRTSQKAFGSGRRLPIVHRFSG